MTLMLLKKYEPASLDGIIGNAEVARGVEKFIREWKGGALMISGSPGTGKSLSVKLASRAARAELVESSAADDRSLKGMQGTLKNAAGQQSLIGRKKVILIEDLDMIDSVKAVEEILKSSKFPVILIAADPYSRKLRNLRALSSPVAFKRVRHDSIAKLLRVIRDKEGLKTSDAALSHISRVAGGDVRAAIIDMESLADEKNIGLRDSENGIFETVKIIFKTRSMENVLSVLRSSEKPPEDVLLWLEWNLAEEYEKPEEIWKALDSLSKADLIAARIMKRQAWSLAKYPVLGAVGVALAKREMYKKFMRYSYPRAYAPRKDNSKLSSILHISSRRVREYAPLLKAMAKKSALPEGIEKEDVEGL
ncbi:MAG: AAA family ATPase [Candidatus Aenigmarchaeota archaeon]|nr:AAA family ATPase [Candidatus Aenigmarchaeota archaeon]